MFIYEFKSTNCLITKIVISGLNLTVYTNKPMAQELNGVAKKFNLKSPVSGDHPKHEFCHNNYIDFSSRGDLIPHKHWKFNTISLISEIPSQMKELFDFLIERQQDSSMRKLEFDNLLHVTNQERLAYGEDAFPKEIQDAFDNYDITSPYISPLEYNDFFAALNSYYNQKYNIQQNSLITHTEDFLGTHWDVIYMKDECGFGQIINQQEQNMVDYYRTLVDLKNTLLKINIRQSDYNQYNEAAYYIEILKRNPNFDKLLPLSQDISDIERYLSKNANLLIFSFIFQAIVITPGLALMTVLALREVLRETLLDLNPDTAFNVYFSTALLCCIGTTCLAKPMYTTAKQTFFDYLKPEDNRQTSGSKPELMVQPHRLL